MKRKFSFNIPPIHVPSSADLRSLAKVYVSPRDIMSASSSPYIERRPLSPTTEAELRLACRAFLKYNKGDDEPNKLDFELVHRYMKTKDPPRNTTSSGGRQDQIEARRRRHKEEADLRRQTAKAEKAALDLYSESAPHSAVPANVGYRRDSPSPRKPGHRAEKHTNVQKDHNEQDKKHASDARDRLHAHAHAVDSDDSYSTPMTTSTDAVYHPASTGMTSLASPNREWLHDTRIHPTKDSETSRSKKDKFELQRREMEKKRSKGVSSTTRQSVEQPRSSSRDLSRTRSIRGEIKEYFRPGSSARENLTRSASKESFRNEASAPKRPGSSAGNMWRSWSLRRKNSDSTLNSSRPDSSRGRSDSQQNVYDDDGSRPHLNLNRELPPLPGLDQWKGEEEVEASPKQPHIAQLMRSESPSRKKQSKRDKMAISPKDREHSTKQAENKRAVKRETKLNETATKKSHRRSMTCPDLKDAKATVSNKENANPAKTNAPNDFDFDAFLTAMERTDIGQEYVRPQQDRKIPAVTAIKASPGARYSLDHSRNDMPNFSRKISVEMSHRQHTAPLVDVVSVSNNVKPKQHRGFFKAIGGLLTRKQSKHKNWTNHVDGRGSDHDFVLHDEAASAPVVKY